MLKLSWLHPLCARLASFSKLPSPRFAKPSRRRGATQAIEVLEARIQLSPTSVTISSASAMEHEGIISFPITVEDAERTQLFYRITAGPENDPGDSLLQFASPDDFYFDQLNDIAQIGQWIEYGVLQPNENCLNIFIHDDPHFEFDETFELELGAYIWDETWAESVEVIQLPAVTGTIINDDLRLQVSIGQVMVNEDMGEVEVPVTVLVPAGWGQHNQVGREWQDQTGQTWFFLAYQIEDGTATSPQDYHRGTGYGELVLSPEEPTGVIHIPIVNDSLEEVGEAFDVTLTGGYALSLRAYGNSSDNTNDGGGWSEFAFINASAVIGIIDNDGPVGTGAGGTGTGGTGTGGTGTGGTGTGGTGTGGTGTGGTGTGGTGTGGTGTGGTGTGGTGTGGTGTGGTGTGGTGSGGGGSGDGGSGGGGSAGGGSAGGGSGAMTPSLMISGSSASEDAGTIEFSIMVTNPGSDAITVNYSTSDATATSPNDYSSVSGSITIPANSTSATISIAVVDDTDPEDPEDFSISISLPSGSTAQILMGQTMGQISDNDGGSGGGGLPAISLSDISIYEGSASYVTIYGSLSQPSSSAVTVTASTMDVSANDGSDYTGQTYTLTIPANTTSFTFDIPLLNDAIVEPTETFDVVLSSPNGASITDDGKCTVTILDLDVDPVASIAGSVLGGEGVAFDNKVSFNVLLSGDDNDLMTPFPATAVTVSYTISFESGDTATSADFVTLSGTVTFNPMTNMFPYYQLVDIALIDDNLVEGTEQFTLTLTSATGALLSSTASAACGTINDNDMMVANNPPVFDPPGNASQMILRNQGWNGDVPAAKQKSLAKVHATDDPAQVVSYAITGGDPGNLFSINSEGKIFATVPGTQLVADQYLLQITATDNAATPLSSTMTLTLNVRDTVMITGKTTAIEGQNIQLEFRRYTANPDIEIDVPFEIIQSTASSGTGSGAFEISNRYADINDFDPSDDRTSLFTTATVHFGVATGTAVTLTLRATPDNTPEGVEGFQVQLTVPTTPAYYELDNPLFWSEDLPNDGAQHVGGGSAVTCFVLDSLTLFCKNNTQTELLDFGEVSVANPGICINDVNQGGIGDCYLMAALAAIARQENGWRRIESIMQQTGPVDFSVDLYKPNGTLKTYNVTLDLSRGYSAAELSGDFRTIGLTDQAEVWPLVLEQALGKMRAEVDGTGDAYGAILPGNTGSILQAITGNNQDPTPAAAQIAAEIRTAFQANKAVVLATTGIDATVTTLTDPDSGDVIPFAETGHAYAVIGVGNINGAAAIQLFDQRQRVIRSFWVLESDLVSIAGALAISTATPPAP